MKREMQIGFLIVALSGIIILATLGIPDSELGCGGEIANEDAASRTENDGPDEGRYLSTSNRGKSKTDSKQTVIDKLFPSNTIGQLLKQHLKSALALGKDAQKTYNTTLNKLRKNDTKATDELIKAYNKLTGNESKFYKWLFVNTLKEIGSKKALDFLTTISNLEISDEIKNHDVEREAYEEEYIIRLAAVEGIANIARTRKYKTAEQRLVDVAISSPHRGVKIAAIRGYIDNEFNEKKYSSYETYIRSGIYRKRELSITDNLPVELHELVNVRPLTFSREFQSTKRNFFEKKKDEIKSLKRSKPPVIK